jgi:hypothetical protein
MNQHCARGVTIIRICLCNDCEIDFRTTDPSPRCPQCQQTASVSVENIERVEGREGAR